ncbi:MAG: cytochrome o ubiquinol oxidase subunit IV [Rhizobiales bacterium]|nr:cytochrome o ubiquinol oxidase subunit IV [Hyphomicrobiales bacterium]
MNADAHTAGHHGADTDSHELPHGSLRSYVVGFALSAVFTAVPFWLVMNGVIENKFAAAIAISILAACQIVVHMICFLHMNTRAEEGWTMMALIFTIIMVVIALAGSLWVMYHLATNMMPLHDMGGTPSSVAPSGGMPVGRTP